MSNKDTNKHNISDFSDSRFDVLMQVYLEGRIAANEADILREYLQKPEYVRRFVLVCKQEQLVHDIICSDSPGLAGNSIPAEFGILREFAQYECNAPAVEIEACKPEPVIIQTVQVPELPKRNKFSILSMLATAALILLVVYIKLTPLQPEPKAAILSDAYKAQWTGQVLNLETGNNIFTNETITLAQGIIELKTERDVTVIIEGPAEFEFKTTTELSLNYGHIYSKVMKKGAGFTVKTPNAMIVDLGTEFSIKVSKALRSTEVQMYKGSAVISNSQDDSGREILKTGVAKAIDSQGLMSDIPFEKNGILDRTVSGYEKKLDELQVSSYFTFNDKVSWVNNYIGNYKIIEGAEYFGTAVATYEDTNNGIADTALFFDATDEEKSYAKFSNMPDYAKESFTVALWFKLSQDKAGNRKKYLISNFDPKLESGWRIGLLDDKLFIRLSDYTNNRKYQTWLTNSTELSNGWHSVVMVVNRAKSTITGYLDGSQNKWQLADPQSLASEDNEFDGNKLSKKIPSNINLSTDTGLHLGLRPRNLMWPFNGWIYDIAIWNKALDSDNIRQLYSDFPLDQ